MSQQLKEVQEWLRQSKKIVALVGAGLSVSSGLPTFRGSQGLWKNYNMIDLATPDAFYVDPGLVWQFYSWRRRQAMKAQPNTGHIALASLSHNKTKEFLTITQNVDGLLIRAGHAPKNYHEIHGSLFELRCTSFTCTFVDRNNFNDPLTKELGSVLDDDFTPDLSPQQLPQCPVCGSLMRPGVVWFGESLLLRALDRIDCFIESQPVDVILVIGTSGTVYPANGYVERVQQRGGKVVIFNTDIDQDVIDGKVDGVIGFQGDAAEFLPKVLECLEVQGSQDDPIT